MVKVINRRPGLTKISFIAHSVGGLVARYAIGRLYRPHSGELPADASDGAQGGDDSSRGTICGLEAMNFITVATPHLGSRGNKQVFFFPANTNIWKSCMFEVPTNIVQFRACFLAYASPSSSFCCYLKMKLHIYICLLFIFVLFCLYNEANGRGILREEKRFTFGFHWFKD